MTDVPGVPSRLSKSSLFSLILGIIFCLPGGGLLAMLLGLIGFFRAGKPGVRGRWMAVVGGILGLLVTIGQVVSVFVLGFAFFAGLFGVLRAPANATSDFIRALTNDDVVAAKEIGPGFDDAAMGRLVDYCKAQGAFVETALPNVKITNDTAHVEGTVKFSTGGTQNVQADLEKVDGKWQVTKITIAPP